MAFILHTQWIIMVDDESAHVVLWFTKCCFSFTYYCNKNVLYFMFSQQLCNSWSIRDTVMIIQALLDPEGVAQRKTKRLKRRVYRTKVTMETPQSHSFNLCYSYMIFIAKLLGSKLCLALWRLWQAQTIWNHSTWLYWWVISFIMFVLFT